jgi:ATP-dependent DNA ligase
MIAPILPMLATAAQPFDSPDYFFEVKWDGVRALAATATGHWQLWGRELADYASRYPELDVLAQLPSGTVVDGELVLFQEGRPDLYGLLRRHQLVDPDRIRRASRLCPVHYMLFDILYHRGRCLMQEPWHRRRAVLADVLIRREVARLVLSEGLAGNGKDFFERMVAQGHEGVMAKLQTSHYLPGQRSSAWRKMKPTQVLPCVIIGYTASEHEIDSVLVASAHQGPLRYVAQVTSGFSAQQKLDLRRCLARRQRSRPVVACLKRAIWVEPDVYCQVQFLEWTAHGRLRSASFKGPLETAT